MKTFHKSICVCLLLIIASRATAQDNAALTLIKQGIQLHDQGKYPQAIEKYQQALKIDPNNMQAEFEMSFSLYASGKGTDAITHLQNLIDKKDPLSAQAYDLLGSIYDDNKEVDKAITAYQQGIKADPKYQRLRYNLALAYLRQGKYPEAELSAIEAIKLDPKHASSQQLYATAALNQNKTLCALLGYCSFLMLEPQTKRSTEAYQQIDQIFKAAGDKKEITITLDKDSKNISPISMATASISLAASAKKAMEEKKAGTPAELLATELNMVFKTLGMESSKQAKKDFFWTFYASYFYKLSQTNNMPAFARLISLSGNPEENLTWFKDHPDELKLLDAWAKSTDRSFD